MRLFVALDIPSDVRAAIARVAAKLRGVCAGARWVRLDGAHVTLKFIGETPSDKVDAIIAALSEVSFRAPVKIVFRGIGFFPNERRPQVLWAGVEAGAELRALAAAVDAALAPLGIARERRAFAPHVTLARFKNPGNLAGLRAAVDGSGPLAFGQSIANEFHLYQSVLNPGGAEYTRLASFHAAE